LFIMLSVLFSSCNYFQLKDSNPDNEKIARVGDKILYKSDLKDLYQSNMSHDDSLKITNNYVESWARREIILQKAAFNLNSQQEDELEEMVKKYKEDLFINSYKADLVSENIDSVFDDSTIKEFYIANNQIFKLNDDLLRYRMISYQTTDKKASIMKELFKKNDSISISTLFKGDFLFQGISMNDSIWIKYPDFINKYPFTKNIDKNILLQNNHIQEFRDNNITHYVYVKLALRSGETAPLQFIKDDIIKMIVHQKKLKYLQDLENKLIQEAIQNNTYEKFKN